MKEKNSQQHSCFLFFFFKPLAVFTANGKE